VQTVAVTAGGSSYAQPPTATISGGGGSGALGTPILSDGVVSIALTAGGSGYTSTPGVTFTDGGGSGATATAVVQNGSVIAVNITNAGQNYTAAPTIGFVGGGGTGAAAVANISGTVVGVALTAAGSGYTALPTVTISGGGGSGAMAVAALQPTSVATVSVISGGTGFGLGSPALPAPPLTFQGGGGSGAVATATLSSNAIGSVNVSNGGKYYTSPPAVLVGAGLNDSAYATVSLMPYGVSGSALETFDSHVWLFDPAPVYGTTIPPGGQFVYSAPNVIWDFATSDGGGGATSTDSFLQTQWINARQSSGYLYLYGDGSVNAISNLMTTGTAPATTAFTNSNVDPQSGLSWRDSLQEYGRSLVAANETGVYGLYGGTLKKVSEKIDQLLSTLGPSESQAFKAVYPAGGGVMPSSATAHIFNVKYYLNLITIYDQTNGQTRNVMVAWNEKDWTVLSQSVTLTQIATQKVGSRYYAWGSNGAAIYPLFNQPSSTLVKKFLTKSFGVDSSYTQKQALACWLVAQDTSGTGAGVTMSVAVALSGVAPLSPVPATPLENTPFPAEIFSPLTQQPSFLSPTPAWGLWGTNLNGVAFTTMGVFLMSTSPDFTLGNLAVGYKDVQAYYG